MRRFKRTIIVLPFVCRSVYVTILHGVLADERYIHRLTYLPFFLLTPRYTFHPENLNRFHPVKKTPLFNGPRSFIPFSPVLSSSKFLKIDLNITIPPTPVSSKWCLSLRFSYQNFVHNSPLPIRVQYPSIHILLDLITRKILKEVTGNQTPRHVVFPFPCYLFLLGSNNLFETWFSSRLRGLIHANKKSCQKFT